MICGLLAAHAAVANGIAAPATALPDFAELESAGAIIGQIKITPENVFDLTDEHENNSFYQLVNRLHITTRPGVIEKGLLFKSGERVSRQKIEETERLLRNTSIRYDVAIKPIAYRDGVVDIEVTTRDSWSLDITGTYSRSGGDNKSSYGIKERNLVGTGIGIGYAATSDVDRSGTELAISYPQAFDGWTTVAFERGRFDDGKSTSFVIDRPFYALDTRYAARGAWSEVDQIESIYNTGEIVNEYRRQLRAAEISGGWSPGLIDGWTQRFSAGAFVQDNTYLVEPGRTRPVPMPVSNDLRALFLRYEVVEDNYLKVKNHNLIERAEYLVVGFNTRLQISRSLPGLGSNRSDWLYAGTIRDGYVFAQNHIFQVAANVERRIASTALPMTQAGAMFKYYAPQAGRTLLFGSLGVDRVSGGGVADQLMIGGTLGLRGYPSRYQAGEQRFLFSIEKRAFTTWYPFRLFRIGGAVFFDAGRAWGGPNQNTINGGTLTDIGAGLRIALDRAAFANILHLDIASPLNRAPGLDSVQFLVKTEFSF